jgi:ParB family chromosome partitioning protein
MSKKLKGLGNGLGGLLGPDQVADVIDLPTAQNKSAPTNNAIPLDQIQAGEYQPRGEFDDDALASLADSIKEHGVLQPIVVRMHAGTKPYEILAGERRFRAAGMAGLTEIPAIIREADNEQALALGLIENIQREDLNPLEEARAIERLIQEFDYTHESAANAIGRSRSATTNLLRLLQLAPPVQQALLEKDLDMGHARALAALSRADQIMLGHRVVERDLSVRETEAEVTAHLANLEGGAGDQKAGSNTGGTKGRTLASGEPDRDMLRLQQQLSDILAASVSVKANKKGRGKMTIEFSGPEQFDGLLDQLGLRKKLDNI